MRSGRSVIKALRARRRLGRFDIHHFHSAEPLPMLASLACRGARRIYTHRGGEHVYEGRRAVRYRLTKLIVRRFDAVTGSPQAAAAVERVLGIPASDVLPTYNGLDFSLLEAELPPERLRVNHGVPAETVVIATAANLRRWKRIDWLLSAVGQLPRDGWVVWILGDGEDRSRLEALASRSPAKDRIRFLGMQTQIADWLHAVDIFVLPSGPHESFGNAVVEAMACALPVVVSADSPAHLEHVAEGRTGFVVSDPAHLAERLVELIRDASLRARVGNAAAEFVRGRYSIDQMLDRFDAVYADL